MGTVKEQENSVPGQTLEEFGEFTLSGLMIDFLQKSGTALVSCDNIF